MSDFSDTSSYLQEAFKFLVDHEWIYNFQLTKFFVERVWQKIPHEWNDILKSLTTKELNNLPYGYKRDHWPESLKHFITMADKLSLSRSQSLEIASLKVDQDLKKGMNPKKLHEVSFMAALVKEECERHQCPLVVDVGAGLGYLGQVIHRNSGIKIIGLESKENNTHGAENRQKKCEMACGCIQTQTFMLVNTPESIDSFSSHLHSLTWPEECHCQDSEKLSSKTRRKSRQNPSEPSQCASRIDKDKESVDTETSYRERNEDSVRPINYKGRHQEFESTISIITSEVQSQNKCLETFDTTGSDQFGGEDSAPSSDRVCMVGLHCCGDLTPTMLRVFTRQPELRSLVCVSCCYHHMTYLDNHFQNFPMSSSVSEAMAAICERYSGWNLNTFGMRLAAQETRTRWKKQSTSDHEFHARNVAYRALLQYCTEQDGLDVRKMKRKVARKCDFESFDTYLRAVMDRTSMNGECLEHYVEKMKEAFQEFEKYFIYIEIITALQVLMQPVLESLILWDRVEFLRENGITASLEPVFDEDLSPRNMAVVANK